MYILGVSISFIVIGLIVDNIFNWFSSLIFCVVENVICSFMGVKEVWYGVKFGGINKWKVVFVYNGVFCINVVFGDFWFG